MKKIYVIALLFVANATHAQTSGLESVILSTQESYWDGSDMSGTSNGSGLFDSFITDSDLEYSNQYDTSWGAVYGYWSNGWAFTNQTSDTLTDLAGKYSSYAGGAYQGNNYTIGKDGAEIVVANNGVTTFSSIYVSNSNYAGSSMLNGDFFAKQFGSPNDASGNPDGTNGEDWFLLTIVGYNLQGDATDSIEFYLADYRFADSNQDYVLKNWTEVNLGMLGTVNKIKFKLSSSDVGQFGMNTPGFFAIDNVSYGVVGMNEEAFDISVYPNPTTDFVNVNTYQKKVVIELYDLSGKKIFSKDQQTGTSRISMLTLEKGIYNLVILSREERTTKRIVKL